MLRKEVSPRAILIATVLILGVVQLAYWRLLVYREPAGPMRGGGGGGSMAAEKLALGLQDVEVETVAGEAPGYVDGPRWKARFCGPNALALESGGSLLVADSRNHRIRRVSPQGQVSTVAGSGPTGGAGGKTEGPALSARFSYPSGVAAGSDGSIFISDAGNHRVCRLKDGQVTVLAGGSEGSADGVGPDARFHAPAALAAAGDGTVWVLDAGDLRVRRIDRDGAVTTPGEVPEAVRVALGETAAKPKPALVAAWSEGDADPVPTRFAIGRRSAGSIGAGAGRFYADGGQGLLLLQRPGSAPALLAGRLPMPGSLTTASDGPGNRAVFALPCAVAAAADGSVYVAEYEGSRIRRLTLPAWLRDGQPRPTGRRRWRADDGN